MATILRSRLRRDTATVPLATLLDPRLTHRARGLLLYILALPEDAQTTSDSLAAASQEGRDAIRNTLRELEDAGYLVRTKTRNDLGRWVTITDVFDTPQEPVEEPVPGPGNPALDQTALSVSTSSTSTSTAVRDKSPTGTGRAARGPAKRDTDEDRFDPFKTLDLWDDPAPPSEPATKPRRGAGPDTAMGLALEFRDRVHVAYKTISGSNEKALTGAFAQWRQQGVTPDEIRRMIQIFCDDRRFQRPGIALWRTFLYRRDTLLERARSGAVIRPDDWTQVDAPEPTGGSEEWFAVESATTDEFAPQESLK